MSYFITYVPSNGIVQELLPPPTTSSLSYVLLPPLPPNLLAQQQQLVLVVTEQQRANIRAQRAKFLLFVKILLRHLRETRNYFLLAKARLLVKEIIHQNRMPQDPHFGMLMESVEKRLRLLVGEKHWRQAHFLMRYYLAKGGKIESKRKRKADPDEEDGDFETADSDKNEAKEAE
jgi:hypothetical protein